MREWLEIIGGAVVMVLLAALFPLFALYDSVSQGDTCKSNARGRAEGMRGPGPGSGWRRPVYERALR